MPIQLPASLHAEIQKLSAEGEALAKAGAYKAAIAKYDEAWQLVPTPQNDWEASTWLLAAIGDACFLSGHFTSGAEAFEYALTCPQGFGNPFLHLRLGQCQFEKNNHQAAAEHLGRAYMLEGKEIFSAEDSKYFEFLKTRIQKPASGIW
ncbi:MAG: tetratricopeptide repeat protein [Pseudomonadota bacterium]|nr:tetratricopeptide repeat protein [Pseudomonadota bacterium]